MQKRFWSLSFVCQLSLYSKIISFQGLSAKSSFQSLQKNTYGECFWGLCRKTIVSCPKSFGNSSCAGFHGVYREKRLSHAPNHLKIRVAQAFMGSIEKNDCLMPTNQSEIQVIQAFMGSIEKNFNISS